MESREYKEPTKQVKDIDSIDVWLKSKAYDKIIVLLETLCSTVVGIKLRDKFTISNRVQNLINLLDKMEEMVEEFPPIQQPQRFGNKAFRNWYEKFQADASTMLKQFTEEAVHPAIDELSVYLTESVGNSTRIDYGTGHELCFMCFISVLVHCDYLDPVNDGPAIVLGLFNRYVLLMRHLQATYCMEPAGSRGVWCLDDFCFLPFYFGSAQLIKHPRLKPSVIPEEDMVVSFYKDFMFLDCIRHINKVKKGPFFEHSNQLWNISGVKLWSKVNTGLMKMYKAEVLCKFPVIQHFLFGSVLTMEPAGSGASEQAVETPTSQATPSSQDTPPFEEPPPAEPSLSAAPPTTAESRKVSVDNEGPAPHTSMPM